MYLGFLFSALKILLFLNTLVNISHVHCTSNLQCYVKTQRDFTKEKTAASAAVNFDHTLWNNVLLIAIDWFLKEQSNKCHAGFYTLILNKFTIGHL